MSFKKILTIIVIIATILFVCFALNPAYCESSDDDFETLEFEDGFVSDYSKSYYAPFKMDVPKGCDFTFQGGAVLNNQGSNPSSADGLNDHPLAGSEGFEVEYINFTDDNFKDYKDVMDNALSFEGSEFMFEEDGVYVYDISNATHFDDDDYEVSVCKVVDGGVVVITGEDEDDCIKMASSVELLD